MTGNTGTSAPRPLPNTLPEYEGFTRMLQEVIKQMTGWKVWTSDGKAMYATRTRDLTEEERDANLAQTIGADNPTKLSDAIAEELRKATALAAKAAKRSIGPVGE